MTAIAAFRATARARLLAERGEQAYWQGELAPSALATATAVMALTLADRVRYAPFLRHGLDWLATHANPDGGWGDTPRCKSNLSTTLLAWSAFHLLARPAAEAKAWLTHFAGGVEPRQLAAAVLTRYGRDRTFSVPILSACALAGTLGTGRAAWENIPPLPFELAVLPQSLFKWLRLPVVSYALPALIAIGQARHHHAPPADPLLRFIRNRARRGSLHMLTKIQPVGGGFLEAIPLTAFVVMSLAGMGRPTHPVALRGVDFLTGAVRTDGSWAIDVNLATWVTTLAIKALAAGGRLDLPEKDCARLRNWLLAQQHAAHPYTGAAPGGWSWTNLSGGVPDADDTAGALLALRHLGGPANPGREPPIAVADHGIRWLLDLQNADGGIPTFCKGWGALPFDRSSPDITAHVLRAWTAWLPDLPPPLQRRIRHALPRALRYLARAQRADGTWLPLWFGNQHASDDENPFLGTAQVLRGLHAVATPDAQRLAVRGQQWLLAAQRTDGSWGHGTTVGSGTVSSGTIEETALAISALKDRPAARHAVERGITWLATVTRDGRDTPAAPIGFYFAKLWYFEKLYPLIFLVNALEGATPPPAHS